MKHKIRELQLLVQVPVVISEEQVNPDGSKVTIHVARINVKGAKAIYKDMIEEYVIKCYTGDRVPEEGKLEDLLNSYVELCILERLGVEETPLRR